uniref:Uncharacterized protein n=1 Tax=Rhizophora mucronata TaxID=61149 RepID=A0A2P2Q7Y6_RHIMU
MTLCERKENFFIFE